MNLLTDLPLRDAAGHVRVVVETPGGSRVKYKYDDQLGLMAWSRLLVDGTRYPYDYGFLPQTLADDGDAVDAIVVADEPTHPGVIVPSQIIGALRVKQQRDGGPIKRNDRIVAVPVFDPTGPRPTDIRDVPATVREEIERFCTGSLALTGKHIELKGWADATEAAALIAAASRRFASHTA